MQTTVSGWAYSVNTPIAVALVFGLAGAFFIAIYFLRRTKK